MVTKFKFGVPIETEAVIEQIKTAEGMPENGVVTLEEGFCYEFTLAEDDVVYGLGEANRGINKRGYIYQSFCTDDPNHQEDTRALYGAHNLIIVSGRKNFGMFFDYPAKMTFDIGYTRQDVMTVQCEAADLYLYEIIGEDAYDIVKQFRRIIGRSYIPPKFAFGFGQSRWGYKTAEDIRRVVTGYRDAGIPLDMVYLDIDYMQDYKDFTVDEERFPDFEGFVEEMREQQIHLVPIIDAGVKIEKGYEVYEEGVAGDYFCKDADGENFGAAVWPGMTHFPDVLNAGARKWFGDKYQFLLSKGIDAFWNDMNEPSIFYTEEGRAEMQQMMERLRSATKEDLPDGVPEGILDMPGADVMSAMNDKEKDYRRFYHNMDGMRVRHDKVHNLFGYNMTRAAGEAFERLSPEKRILMFSRSSYIGMHRYGGIWTGDNKSWWSHLLLCIKQLPSLNMCGFLYCGCDLGGFGSDTTRDLLLRFTALGVFTPLMRNHSALGTREQECYQFEHTEDFRSVIGVRYRLVPYLYSEYMKAALHDDLYFKPLGFVYPHDRIAVETEDQLLIGNEVMIAPVYVQNASGRTVYLPEEMMFVKFLADGSLYTEIMPRGHHYISVKLNEVPLFIRQGACIPVADEAACIPDIDTATIQMVGYEGASYERYDDDGITRL